jgi:NAD(P)-dependent dehydrogenase (short-subunit alcohol dehydrogenase family)
MTALVTGGGRGIGQGIALGLVKAGYHVAITARSQEQLNETLEMAEGEMTAVSADIADPAAIAAMAAEVERRLGPVDLLVNNAGSSGPFGTVWEADPEEWWRCQEVNLRGPFLCCRAVLPDMIARKSGRIINVASGAGVQALANMSAYVASKTALIRFSEQLAVEAAPYGIAVFPIRPGIVRTTMVEQGRLAIPAIQQMLDAGLEVTPAVVSDLVLFLASGKADALSGRLFSVQEDLAAMLNQVDHIAQNDLYLLRLRKL